MAATPAELPPASNVSATTCLVVGSRLHSAPASVAGTPGGEGGGVTMTPDVAVGPGSGVAVTQGVAVGVADELTTTSVALGWGLERASTRDPHAATPASRTTPAGTRPGGAHPV